MIIPNPSQIAIDACQKNCANSWKRFAAANNISELDSPDAFHIAKTMFWAGFQYGSQFVTSYISNLPKHSQNKTTRSSKLTKI